YRNDASFQDKYAVIYGHRMSKGRMFSDVGEYANKEYFANHSVGMLYTPSGNYELRFIAFASVYGDTGEIYNIGAFRKEEAVRKIMENAKVKTDFDPANLGDVVLLSTCSTEELMLRDVLLAEKIKQ
ncbi:MAG: class B sortase, partial [Candidatus Saccharibacteria bacterium]|nr:class B sortase [Candidatus Saccharibacteria bacterium]